MNITNYTDYFHDGALYEIQHLGNQIIFSMSSAEMDPDDLQDDIPLSPNNTLKGKLHVEGIKSIKINDVPFYEILKIQSDTATIFSFEIKKTEVFLQIIWEKYMPRLEEVGFSTIIIEAEKIYWEPVPDLVDPFW